MIKGNAIVARNEQLWLAHETRIGFGGLAALDARGVCNSAWSYGAGKAGSRGCARNVSIPRAYES